MVNADSTDVYLERFCVQKCWYTCFKLCSFNEKEKNVEDDLLSTN